jgi:hypothetical protein
MSEHLHRTTVALRDRASGRFFADGATWSAEPEEALLLDAAQANVVLRFSCEPGSVELVTAADLGDDDGRCRAVA